MKSERDILLYSGERRPLVHAAMFPDEPLPHPHYTDERFRHPQTVYGPPGPSGEGHPGLTYEYDDRMWEWDRSKAEAGHPRR